MTTDNERADDNIFRERMRGIDGEYQAIRDQIALLYALKDKDPSGEVAFEGKRWRTRTAILNATLAIRQSLDAIERIESCMGAVAYRQFREKVEVDK